MMVPTSWSWWAVVVECPNHPDQPDPHKRYVQANTAEVAGKKAVAQFRAEHWYTGSVDVLEVDELKTAPALPPRRSRGPRSR